MWRWWVLAERRLLTGNQAVAEAAIAAGVKVVVGYPITPVTDILEYLARKLPALGGVVFQTEDELAAINALVGAVFAGAKALTATSGPGYSLMAEGLSFAAMVEAPIVVVYGMRCGPSTGIATGTAQMDFVHSRYAGHGDYYVVVYGPWSAQEAFDLTIKAFNVAWRLRVPVVLLTDRTLARTRELVVVRTKEELELFDRKKPTAPPGKLKPYEPDPADLVPPMPFFGEGYAVLVESLAHDERGYYTTDPAKYEALVRRLVEKVERNKSMVVESRSCFVDDCDILFVAYGSVARSVIAVVKELRSKGVKACLWRPISLWPLDENALIKAARAAERVVVVELSLGQLRREVERIVGRDRVHGVSILSPVLPGPREIVDRLVREGVLKL